MISQRLNDCSACENRGSQRNLENKDFIFVNEVFPKYRDQNKGNGIGKVKQLNLSPSINGMLKLLFCLQFFLFSDFGIK